MSLHAPQSESTQPVRVMSGPPKTSVQCLVAYRYRIVRCAAIQWAFPGLLLNWARCWTAKATLGRVAVAAYMIDPTVVRYGIFFIRSFSTLGCLMLDPIRYVLVKEMMYLIGSRLRDFPGMCHPHLCQVQSPIWSIPNIPNIPEIVW